MIDDHSRVLLASVPLRTVKAADAAAVFHQAAGAGYPSALLSDNAAVFSGASRKGKVLLETELERLAAKAAAGGDAGRACGAAGPLPPALQRRPAAPRARTAHATGGLRRQGQGRTRFHSAAGALPRALRHRRPQRQGHAALRLAAAPHRAWRAGRGRAIVLFVADRDVRIVDADGELLRELVLDPTRDYQRQSA